MARTRCIILCFCFCLSLVKCDISEQSYNDFYQKKNMVIIAGVPVYNYHLRSTSFLENASSSTDWIVMMKANVSDGSVQSLCTDSVGKCLEKGLPSEAALPFAEVRTTESGLQELLERRGLEVAFVEPDIEGSGASRTAPEALPMPTQRPWGLERVQASRRSDAGRGVHIYVVDSGIRFTHKEFTGRVQMDFQDTTLGESSIQCERSPSCGWDDHGHGTHCAATAAGENYGVAKAATVHNVKVLNRQNSFHTHNFLRAIRWLLQHAKQPAVVSMSLQTRGRCEVMNIAVEQLVQKGMTVVAAAGNYGMNACESSPGSARSAITVGAIDASSARWKEQQSVQSRGLFAISQKETPSEGSNWGSCVDVFAPGVDVLSAGHADDTSGTSMSGTSMAAPLVSGSAAVLLSGNPRLTPHDVKQILLKHAYKGEVRDPMNSPNLILRSPSCPSFTSNENGYPDAFGKCYCSQLTGGVRLSFLASCTNCKCAASPAPPAHDAHHKATAPTEPSFIPFSSKPLEIPSQRSGPEDLKHLSVSELKKKLREVGGDPALYLEKKELVEAILKLSR